MSETFPDSCDACGNIMGLCICQHPVLFEVANILALKGYNAAYEYPGYVGVTLPDGRIANFGNANVDYGADWLESDVVLPSDPRMTTPPEPIDFFMPETATAPELVAAIEAWIGAR